MKTRYSLLIVAALFALTVSVAIAEMGTGRMAGPKAGAGQGYGMHAGMGWFGPELKLTPDQMAQLKKINTDFMTANAPLRADLMARHKELAALIAAPVLDEGAIRAKMAEIESLRAQMVTAKTDKLIASMMILTAEQRAKIAERMKTRPGPGMEQGRGPGRGMGKGPGACKYCERHRGGAGTAPHTPMGK